jgi:hypothetical protein
LLIGAYADALSGPRQQKFRDNTEGKLIQRQLDKFNKMLKSHLKALLPGDLKENLDVAILAVFAMIRTHRTAAGHPTGKVIPREEAYANLTVFPSYLKVVYQLIEWLQANAPLS